MIKIKLPKKKSNKEIKSFFKKKGLEFLVLASESKKPKNWKTKNEKLVKITYVPELKDLYRLYNFIILNKRITILEFGSGWSSLISFLALYELKKNYSRKIKELKRKNPFELFILENEKKFLNISKNRIIKFCKKNKLKNIPKIHCCFSEVEMTLYENKIATQYKNFPKCNPDFIYLDGPGQFNVKKSINGINTKHEDMMPMVCDILKFEYFFTPGTIIICDGRSANAKFLKDHFKRNWKYKNDKSNEQHIFWLDDPILGKYNKLQLQFYKK